MWIDPKPRNFTIAIFRCRSTPTGTLPTDTDLYDTVGRGMLNSNMPHWLPADRSGPREPGRLCETLLATLGDGKTRHAHRHSTGATGHGRSHQSGPRAFPEAGVLEVPWGHRDGAMGRRPPP